MSQYDASHPDPGGRFLQLSGLIVTFDVRRAIGQRVVEARVAVTGEKVVFHTRQSFCEGTSHQ